MNDYLKKLDKYNEEIDEIELLILKKKLELTYQEKLLKKIEQRKRKLLTSYNKNSYF
tara:strand:- start:521 stop:691 length:171 start_codon:yes stop_codon:yes gene_type:complete